MNSLRVVVASSVLLFSTVIFATNNPQTNLSKLNQATTVNCPNLQCVRSNIDTIDAQLVKLIGLRLQYVKQAGELKKGQTSVHDQARENEILASIATQAKQAGYPPQIAQAIFKTILAQANVYEAQYHSTSK